MTEKYMVLHFFWVYLELISIWVEQLSDQQINGLMIQGNFELGS